MGYRSDPYGDNYAYLDDGVSVVYTSGGSATPTPKSFVYSQNSSASVWNVVHNLGFQPNVFIEDTNGDDVEADVSHTSTNELVIRFSAPLSGTAYLS